jgi:ABC-type transporter Mla subunit MlaD
VTDLRAQIEQHARDLAALGRAVEALAAEIEAATSSARDTLQAYQHRKAEANATLAEASERYSSARRLFARVSDIEQAMLAAKTEHARLSGAVNRAGDNNAIEQMRSARRAFRALAERIEGLQRDAGESTEQNKTEGPA